MIDGEAFDGLEEDVGLRPTVEEAEPLTVGEPAELHLEWSPSEEFELLAAVLDERIKAGTDQVTSQCSSTSTATATASCATDLQRGSSRAPSSAARASTPKAFWWARSNGPRAWSSNVGVSHDVQGGGSLRQEMLGDLALCDVRQGELSSEGEMTCASSRSTDSMVSHQDVKSIWADPSPRCNTRGGWGR